MLLIFYDTMAVPVELSFHPGPTAFSRAAFWFVLIFWTVDIPLTFVTGTFRNGEVCMCMRKIAHGYLRTWLLLDVTLVSSDWLVVIWQENTWGALSMARTMRILRIMRALRLLRLAKLQKIIELIVDNIASEYVNVCIHMVQLGTVKGVGVKGVLTFCAQIRIR